MLRTFRYRLKPTRHQAKVLGEWLAVSCELYNAALEERRGAWKVAGKSIGLYDQFKSLTEIRAFSSDVASIPVDIAREPLRRVDRAFQAFFRRVKAGQKPGYPRFRSRDRYNSLAFTLAKASEEAITVPKLGCVRFKAHRKLRGRVKSASLVRSPTGKTWSVSLVSDLGQAPEKQPVSSAVGIDVGLSIFASLSDGQQIENPRWLKQSEEELAAKQRILAPKRKGSNNRRQARRNVARCYEKIRNRRNNFCHHVSKWLVATYDLIAFEALSIQGMTKDGNFSKSIIDAAWGILLRQISYKAEEAGRYAVAVDPRGTSQLCSGCGEAVPKSLWERTHRCPRCELVLDRDHNAARNILALGRSAAGLIEPRKG